MDKVIYFYNYSSLDNAFKNRLDNFANLLEPKLKNEFGENSFICLRDFNDKLNRPMPKDLNIIIDLEKGSWESMTMLANQSIEPNLKEDSEKIYQFVKTNFDEFISYC